MVYNRIDLAINIGMASSIVSYKDNCQMRGSLSFCFDGFYFCSNFCFDLVGDFLSVNNCRHIS